MLLDTNCYLCGNISDGNSGQSYLDKVVTRHGADDQYITNSLTQGPTPVPTMEYIIQLTSASSLEIKNIAYPSRVDFVRKWLMAYFTFQTLLIMRVIFC
jgi:hypothetical protein